MSVVLVGRGREAHRLAGLLAGAREDRCTVLVLCGEPRIGKTMLLDLAVQLGWFRLLRARGVEAESEIGFADLLAQLVGAAAERAPGCPAGMKPLGPAAVCTRSLVTAVRSLESRR
jgi:hypothetical protein